MEAKQKAIQAAYGDAWKTVAPHTDSNGWVQRIVTGRSETNGMEPHKLGFGLNQYDLIGTTSDGGYRWRLTSLRGIDQNNGWFRCDNAFVSPPDESRVHVYRSGEYWGTMRAWELKKLVNKCGTEDFTHWKPVEEVKPPLY